MIQFLEHWGIVIITMSIIFIIIFLPYGKIFKPTNYNSKDSFMEGYSSAENEIKKGKNPTTLFNQCQGAEDNWDRGWVQACSNYKFKKK
jgi:hypothetical protein